MPRIENKKIILLFGCLCIFFPGSFVFGFPGVMAVEWQTLFGANQAQIGRIMFFVLAGTGFSMYLAGRLQEKFETAYIVFAGAFLCAVSMIAVGYAQSMNHVYLWAFAEGFFCGFVYLPCMGFFQKLFPENKGFVTGILNLTFGGASAVMSPLFAWICVTKGCRFAGISAGVLALVLGTFVAFFIRMPNPDDEKNNRTKPTLLLKKIIQMPAFWFLWWVWALAGAAGVSLIVLSSSFGDHLSYDITQSVYILICFNVLNGIGRVVCGRMSDVYSKNRILHVVFLMAAVAYCLMPWFTHLYMISFLACFIGLSFGALFTVSAPLVTDVFGLENFGKIFGMIFTAYGFVAGFIGPWLSGLLLDITDSNYMMVFGLFAIFYFVSSMLILRVKKVDF